MWPKDATPDHSALVGPPRMSRLMGQYSRLETVMRWRDRPDDMFRYLRAAPEVTGELANSQMGLFREGTYCLGRKS